MGTQVQVHQYCFIQAVKTFEKEQVMLFIDFPVHRVTGSPVFRIDNGNEKPQDFPNARHTMRRLLSLVSSSYWTRKMDTS